MAYSQQDIYNKIGDLLVELNEQYANLNKDSVAQDRTQVLLLAAQAKYLAAHLDILGNLKSNTESFTSSLNTNTEIPVSKEEHAFTPAPSFEEHEADSQPVLEEIQEVKSEDLIEETEVALEAPEYSIEEEETQPEKTEGIKFEGFGQIEDSVTDNVTDQVEAKAFENIETEAEPAPVSSYYSHTSSSNYTSIEGAGDDKVTGEDTLEVQDEATEIHEEPVEAQHVTPVVQEVVIEEKKVEIEAEAPEPSLNDLAHQAEQTPARKLTLNELIQQQKQAGLTNANQFQTTPSKSSDTITDLKTGVSLNDKLLFIKDLFNGYSLAYSEAIELLNRFDNFSEADAFLQTNYALKNNWASKPQTVDKLYVVLRKKYN